MQCQSFTVVVDQRMHAILYHSHRNRQLPSTIKISQDLVHPHQQVCPSMISAQTLAMLPSRFGLFNLFRHPSSAIASGTLTPEAPGFRPSVGASAKGQSPRGGIVRPTQKHTPQRSRHETLWNSLKTWGRQEITTRLMKRTKLCIVLCTFSLCVYLFICLHFGYSACSMYYLSFLCLICLLVHQFYQPNGLKFFLQLLLWTLLAPHQENRACWDVGENRFCSSLLHPISHHSSRNMYEKH